VVDAPVDALLARADELARRWGVALILARPLEGMGGIPLEDLAREAPSLCAQAVRALESDAELERIAASGAAGGREESTTARRLAALAGAPDAQAAVAAVEALRGVLWEALLEELRWPIIDSAPARQVADLADRLAHVCATALAATLAQGPATLAQGPATTVHDSDVAPFAGREELFGGSERSSSGRGAAVLVDEREDLAASQPVHGRPLPWDTPLRAVRSEERPDAWIEDSAAEGGDAVMRVTRRPTAPADRLV
jgi:hypothetical protein